MTPQQLERGSWLSPCERREPVALEIELSLSKSGFSPDGKKLLSGNKVLFLELEEAQPSLVLTLKSLRAPLPLGRGGAAAWLFSLILSLPPAEGLQHGVYWGRVRGSGPGWGPSPGQLLASCLPTLLVASVQPAETQLG